LEIAVAPGEYRNDTNASLMTIADLKTVWITSNVPESRIRLIQVGERVDIELAAYPGEVFRGQVKRIADTVDPETRTIKSITLSYTFFPAKGDGDTVAELKTP
jgi:cobalt-zinc-cadmium efflux system membrane fusion protein